MIELLIAIVILLVGIVSVAELVPAAIETNYRNRNDSTALIMAQRLLEQMGRQPLNVQNAGFCAAAAFGQYFFCDNDTNLIALGQVNPGTVNTADGCPLDPTGQMIDFGLAPGSCPPGYRAVKVWVWNPDPDPTVVGEPAIQKQVELRWHVITRHSNGVPVRKVFILGARTGVGGVATSGYVTINLQTVVSR